LEDAVGIATLLEISFVQGSAEVSHRGRVELAALAERVAAAATDASAQKPPGKLTVRITGYGNGGEVGGIGAVRDRLAEITGRRRARSVQAVLAGELRRALGDGSPIGLADIAVQVESAGRNGPAGMRDSRRRAVVEVAIETPAESRHEFDETPTSADVGPSEVKEPVDRWASWAAETIQSLDAAADRVAAEFQLGPALVGEVSAAGHEAVSGPTAKVAQARVDRPKVEGDLPGAGVRAAIVGVLREASFDGPRPEMLVELVDQAFSDENLTKTFQRALDGGYVADFGTRAGRGLPQVTVEVVGLTKRGELSEVVTNFDFGRSSQFTRHSSSSMAPPPSGGWLSVNLPVKIMFIQLKLGGGAANVRGASLTSTTSHGRTTNVTESNRPATAGEYQATYKITVQMPGRRWWSQSQTRVVESVDTAVRLVWPRDDTAVVGGAEQVSPEAIEHAEFSQVGAIYQAVESELGPFKPNDPAATQFREWLGSLSNQGPELFSGTQVVPVRWAVAPDGDLHRVGRRPRVAPVAEHGRDDRAHRADERDERVGAVDYPTPRRWGHRGYR
jgi:hypothetical protein